MKRQQNEKMNYLYGRLSKDDERFGESMSIENQRKILTAYAEENGLLPYEFIFDDGYSGTDWERPAFNRLLTEIEAGNVAACVVKDMSRFGRDYLKVGFYSEILFPKYDVRLIAVHDNVDSEHGENDFTPIVNLFNEWFVKSTSQKIRAVWQSKGKSGERLAVIPIYGYRKGEDGKTLAIDDESAAVVRRIFTMFTEGVGAAAIARTLMSERLLNPSAYKYEKGIMSKPRPMKDPYFWNATSIHKILDAPEYLGHTINFKTWSKSYKDSRCRWNPPEKRLVFENTHPAIIDESIWAIVRKMRQTKRRAPRYGNVGIFTGLVYCSDCNAKLYYLTREIKNKSGVRYEGAYSCSEYRKATQYQEPRKCTYHYISETNLAEIVLENLRSVLAFALTYEREFAQMVMDKSELEQKREIIEKKRLLAQKRKRVGELDTLFDRMYEDSVSGKISEEQFARMSPKYELEQRDLRAEITVLETELLGKESRLGDVDRFLVMVRKSVDIQELTPAIANEFIDRIIVHDPEKAIGNRVQKVEIIYNGVGAVEIPTTQVNTREIAAS
jgi:DNA invertase Pin-like site-specific DNA recombinase